LSQLNDLIVLELASVLAGPGVGQFFAELGAEVIKVENPSTGGDVTRGWRLADEATDDRSAYFCSVNWGKKSIALDLNHPEGREIVLMLARKAHIVLASFKPGDAEKLGVDYQTLSKEKPGLIYGQITGYGSDDQRVGYDAIIQAEAGFMSMNGEPGGHSLKMPVALMDILAGHHLKEGLLLALIEKMKTGRGRLVEVSLIQAAVSSLANQASNFLVAGKVPGKHGSAHPNIAPYGDVFLTRDGKEVLLAIGTDRQFSHLCKILKISQDSHDFPFKTNIGRVQKRIELNRILEACIRQTDRMPLMQALHGAKIPAGTIRNVAEVMEDTRIRDLLMSNGGLRGIRSFAAQPAPISSHLSPPPHLGEHSLALLQQVLKISPTAVADLQKRGIVQ
jgi:crotonobetainyl-CoA:carnitine CoA-transferase CaiB-like acyl-CoA transferase